MSLSNTSTASAGSARGASNASPAKDKQLMRLVIQLLRPYRGWLLIAAHSRTPSSTVTAILPQRQDRHADASSPLKILRAQDTVIIERLVRAVNRGVSVHIMARPAHKMKANKLVEGVGGLHIMDDVGAKDSHSQAPETARQDAARGRKARDRRIDQPNPWQFRRTTRAGNRNYVPPCRKAPCRDIAPGLETFAQTRFVRRGASRRL